MCCVFGQSDQQIWSDHEQQQFSCHRLLNQVKPKHERQQSMGNTYIETDREKKQERESRERERARERLYDVDEDGKGRGKREYVDSDHLLYTT